MNNLTKSYSVSNLLFRIAGAAGILSGVLMIVGFFLHPAGEDAIYGTDLLWVPAHGLLWLSYTISLVAWVGLFIFQSSVSGTSGIIAFVIIIIGSSFTTWIFSSDVTFVPVIAAESPGLFKKIYTGFHLTLGIAGVLTWVLGNILFGISIIRSKVFNKITGYLLVFGTVIIPISYLAGLPVKVIAIGASAAGIAQIWLGYDLVMKTR